MTKQPDLEAASIRLDHINALADLVISADQATGADSLCEGTLSATMAMIMDEVREVNEALGNAPRTKEDEWVHRTVVCVHRPGEEDPS